MTVPDVGKLDPAVCPPYCNINHRAGIAAHFGPIAGIELPGECVDVSVNVSVGVTQGYREHLVELSSWFDDAEPTTANLTPDEARRVRDAIDKALALISGL